MKHQSKFKEIWKNYILPNKKHIIMCSIILLIIILFIYMRFPLLYPLAITLTIYFIVCYPPKTLKDLLQKRFSWFKNMNIFLQWSGVLFVYFMVYAFLVMFVIEIVFTEIFKYTPEDEYGFFIARLLALGILRAPP